MPTNVQIAFHQIFVELHSTNDHPDALTDLTNRAKDALAFTVALAKEQNIDITNANVYVSDAEDEDEEA